MLLKNAILSWSRSTVNTPIVIGCVYSGMENHDINVNFKSMFWGTTYQLPLRPIQLPFRLTQLPFRRSRMPVRALTGIRELLKNTLISWSPFHCKHTHRRCYDSWKSFKSALLSLFFVVQVPGYILAAISLHFMGRRGPTILFHVLVGVFMVVVASIQLLGPTPLSQGLNVFSQVSKRFPLYREVWSLGISYQLEKLCRVHLVRLKEKRWRWFWFIKSDTECSQLQSLT